MAATFEYNGQTHPLADPASWPGTPLEGFMKDWTNQNDYVWGHTSGSTGEPKPLKLSKEAMKASARLTNRHFGLKPGDTILLCLSTNYIAGKMIVVRALEGGLRIVVAETKSLPEWATPITFAAFVPMQIEALLHHSEESRQRLRQVGTMIIGGSPLSDKLQAELLALGVTNAYTTYGMTETLSHVAVARIGEAGGLTYHALEGITLATDQRGCLVIHAPHIQAGPIVTNDVVETAGENAFCWKGRWDNVVNSGGIKLFPEKMEKTIAPLLPHRRYYLAGAPSEKFGTMLVLKIEGEPFTANQLNTLEKGLNELLEHHEQPKKILFVSRFAEIASGKVKRL